MTQPHDEDIMMEMDHSQGDLSQNIEKQRIKNEKRKVRQEYRKLISETEANRKELLEPTNNGLMANVDKANELYQKVVFGTHEATLDAKLLVMSADLGMQKARHLRMGQGGFDETEFISRLVNKMGGHEIDSEQNGMDWSKIGRMAAKWTRKVPTMDFMLGPMSVEHKSRSFVRGARVVRDPKAMRKPQEMREEDIARQENETTKNVMQISDILEACSDKVNLFELVVNPDSFGQTVENIFYLSFLVRDGKVSISEENMDDPNRGQYDDDDEVPEPNEGANIQPMVELTETPTAEDYQSGLLKKQMVMEIDVATWRDLIEIYDIRRPMIPTRHTKEQVEKGKCSPNSDFMAPSSQSEGIPLNDNSTQRPLTSTNSFRRKASIDNKTGQPYHYYHRRHNHHDPTDGRSPSPPFRAANKIQCNADKALTSIQRAATQSWPSFLVQNQLALSCTVIMFALAAHVLVILKEARSGHSVDWIANFSALIPPPIWNNMPLAWTRASLGGPAIENRTPKADWHNPNEARLSLAMTLQYQVVNIDETTGERQVLYGKGWNDLYMVLLWVMIWTALREAAMTFVFIPLGQYFKVGGQTPKFKANVAQGQSKPDIARIKRTKEEEQARQGKLLRFAEQGWLVLYDGCMWSFGIYLLYNSQYWSDTTYYWRDYPNTHLDATMKWYYLIQFAFWLQQLLLAILGIEKRRKDFLEFMIHHIITCLLVGFSYSLNFTSVGHAIFCAMDFSDIVLAACKMLKYMKKDRLADVGFVFFVFTWVLSRHYYYGIIVWSVFTEAQTYGNSGWDPSKGMYLDTSILLGFKVLLLSLYMVLLFWLFMILRVVMKVINGENVQDVRSEDEEEEEIAVAVTMDNEVAVDSKTNFMTFSNEALSTDKISQGTNLLDNQRSRSTANAKSHAM
ncbi:sphingosine N-acyltransferase lag1 [Mortierella sp. AM989]|nr:sphingosine N-acyltransferase lag1 [Mortierella sp. AM989]